MREFYANFKHIDFNDLQLIIKVKIVRFDPEQINEIHGLPNHPLESMREKDACLGTWVASKVCPKKNLSKGHAPKRALGLVNS